MAEVERYLDLDALTRSCLTVAFCGTNDWAQVRSSWSSKRARGSTR